MNKTSQEHAFIRIEKDIKAGKIPGLVLLCGEEDYLTNHYRDELVSRLSEPVTRELDVTVFSREGFVVSDIAEELETLPVMSKRKIVVLDSFVNDRGKLPTKDLEEDQSERKEMMSVIENSPETCLLIITADKQKSSGDHNKQSSGARLEQLKKTVTKAGGNVYDFGPLEKNQLRSFVVKRFQKGGKTCTEGVLRHIMYDTGYGSKYTTYDLYLLENDLKKIMAYCGDREMVTEDDLHGTLTVSPENNVFAMLEAMSAGRTDQALTGLHTILYDGASEFAVVANLVRQIEIMLIARELMDDNNSLSQAVRYLEKEEKVHKFRAEKATKVAARFTGEQLRNMLIEAIAVEDNIKSGIMSPGLALEYFMAQRKR